MALCSTFEIFFTGHLCTGCCHAGPGLGSKLFRLTCLMVRRLHPFGYIVFYLLCCEICKIVLTNLAFLIAFLSSLFKPNSSRISAAMCERMEARNQYLTLFYRLTCNLTAQYSFKKVTSSCLSCNGRFSDHSNRHVHANFLLEPQKNRLTF